MARRSDLTPLLMSLVLLVAIGVLTGARLQRGLSLWTAWSVDGDVLFSGLYVLWILLEARIGLRDVNMEGKRTADFATCQIYACGQALTFLSALWFPSGWSAPNTAHSIGLGFFAMGVCYRLWAVQTLGRLYSHRVRIAARHRLVDTGPYRYTRHPAYAGMIAAHAGVVLFFANAATAGAFLFVLIPAIGARIFVEEKMLSEIDDYNNYAKTRKRLIPGIW